MAKDTRIRILDSAERLFALHGYHCTSMRMITSEASVNLAAVNYHFGSKAGLLQAVYERRLTPLNLARLQRLAQLRQQFQEQPIPVASLVEALVEPALMLNRDEGYGYFVTLLGRSYFEPVDELAEKTGVVSEEILNPFFESFMTTLRPASVGDLHSRLHFMFGVIAYCMARGTILCLEGNAMAPPNAAPEELTQRLVAFICEGLGKPGA